MKRGTSFNMENQFTVCLNFFCLVTILFETEAQKQTASASCIYQVILFPINFTHLLRI